MTGISAYLNLFSLVSILISSGAQGVKIQVYRYSNFSGLIWESNSTANCNNIPQAKRSWVISIRTDTCFIAYYDPDCKSSHSQKYMPGDTLLHRWIKSFHVCNEKEGGSQLNIDITEYLSRENFTPGVLESYRNVCSCVSVPQYVQNMEEWSIDNHHNALLAYYEPDCSENKQNSLFIHAGHNYYFTNMHKRKKTDSVTNATYKIQSFGPDPNLTCFQTSCNSSLFATTESSILIEVSTTNEINIDADLDACCISINKRLQVLTNQFMELQVNQSDIRNEQTAYFTKLSQAFSEHKLELRNFTEKFKSDLRKLFA